MEAIKSEPILTRRQLANRYTIPELADFIGVSTSKTHYLIQARVFESPTHCWEGLKRLHYTADEMREIKKLIKKLN